MKTVLQIRVDSENENVTDYIELLQSVIPTLNTIEKLESLILRNSDNEIYDFLNNLEFLALNEESELVENYKKIVEKNNGDFFISINFDLEESFPSFFLRHTIESILERFALLLNLSYNFSIDLLESVTFNDKNEVINISEIIISDLKFAYEHSEKIKWPSLEKIELEDVVESFSFNNYSLEGVSKNDFHRAVNSFSHIFFGLFEKSSDILFWNMVGIEALLGKGNKDIQAQIKEKSALILGEPTEFKKKLNELYAFRSKLVHGEINFPAKFSSDEDLFESEYWDYNAFATSILLSLIRHLIKNKKYQFEFQYRYLP